jgi:hypothetical protein
MPEITRAKTLHQGQFTRLIKITQATSRYPERDVFVLMLGHHCGMGITEISRLTVADVMHASGKLRAEVSPAMRIPGVKARHSGPGCLPAIPHREGHCESLRAWPIPWAPASPATGLQQPGGWNVAEHEAAGIGDRRATRLQGL